MILACENGGDTDAADIDRRRATFLHTLGAVPIIMFFAVAMLVLVPRRHAPRRRTSVARATGESASRSSPRVAPASHGRDVGPVCTLSDLGAHAHTPT